MNTHIDDSTSQQFRSRKEISGASGVRKNQVQCLALGQIIFIEVLLVAIIVSNVPKKLITAEFTAAKHLPQKHGPRKHLCHAHAD